MSAYWVYMLTNWTNDVLYIGFTNNLERRISEHRQRSSSSFTGQYALTKLVFQELYDDPNAAIRREKQLKGWKRERKNALISDHNPTWQDLSANWYEKDVSF